MTWEEICADPQLARLSYRIETDKWGNIVMSSPPDGMHSFRQSRIVALLEQTMSGGFSLVVCPVQTAEGVRAMDSAWMSIGRFEQLSPEIDVHQVAPEICVEVRSPGNSFGEILEKFRLYFGAGASECWVCDRRGLMSFFDADGPIPHSKLCPDFPEKLH